MRKSEERALEAFPPHNGASEQWIQAHLKGICGDYIKGYEQAIKDVEKEIEHRTLNAHEMPNGAKDKEFYCGMDAAFSDILVYLDSLND